MLRGRKGSRRRHQGERMGQQVPEQVLESSGSKESWWHQKLRSGADQGWQVSPQRREVCAGVAVDDLVGLCAPLSCKTASQSRCQTKFGTGAVVQLWPLPCWRKSSTGLFLALATYEPLLCYQCLDSIERGQIVLVVGSWSEGRAEAPKSQACLRIWGEAGVADQVWQVVTSALFQPPDLDQGVLSAPNSHRGQFQQPDLTTSHPGCLHRDQRSESCRGLE